MANDFRSARYWAWEIMDAALHPGAVCVDATLGNGHDTLKMCEAVGDEGRVYGFDIQPEAVENTRNRLRENGVEHRAVLFCEGHEHMAERLPENSCDGIMFNLGWLPGKEHAVTTRTETTLRAAESALRLLREDGVLTICIYPGHAEGAREKEALIGWASSLNDELYDVMLRCYLNQVKDPPLMLAIRKNLRRKTK